MFLIFDLQNEKEDIPERVCLGGTEYDLTNDQFIKLWHIQNKYIDYIEFMLKESQMEVKQLRTKLEVHSGDIDYEDELFDEESEESEMDDSDPDYQPESNELKCDYDYSASIAYGESQSFSGISTYDSLTYFKSLSPLNYIYFLFLYRKTNL